MLLDGATAAPRPALSSRVMSAAIDQTETLSVVHSGEITISRPGRVALQICAPNRNRTVEIEDEHLSLGASPRSAVRIDDPKVSQRHCALDIKEEGVILRDCGSKNGTWINGVRVAQIWLPVGGTFNIGETSVRLQKVDPVEVPVSTSNHFGAMVGSGTVMGELFAKLRRIAERPIDVLCVGETGTGKELVARGIHDASDRRDGPFVVVDCTTLNGGIAESILFGHRRGSFTDASRDHAGLLEKADGGTLFLDEIGELPLDLQPKLLRCLERRETRRIGGDDYTPFDARVIAATNKDLLKMISKGLFRDDLYYRLATMRVDIPNLRDRGDGNTALLADVFLERFAKERGAAMRFDRGVYPVLKKHPWPGNVRELCHAIRSVAMMVDAEVVYAHELPRLEVPEDEVATVPSAAVIEDLVRLMGMSGADAQRGFRRIYGTYLMTQCNGNLTRAARMAGICRNTLKSYLCPSTGE